MILTCPECATRYQTDAALFVPDGRTVRCAKCSHVWHQAAPEDEPVLAPDEEVADTDSGDEFAMPERSAYAGAREETEIVTPAPARWLERSGFALGWLGLALIIFVIGWSALRYRQDIASLWPQSSSLYALLGMKVNTVGIELDDVTFHHQTEDGEDVLAISGKLVNITAHELSVPQIRVTLSDDERRELYHWNFQPHVATLAPQQVASFVTRLSSPPPRARHLEVRFAERGH